jgi:hypothetical protein
LGDNHNRSAARRGDGVVINNSGQKLSFSQNMNQMASRKAQDAIVTLGFALPCRVLEVQGSIVQVAFEIVDPVIILPRVWMPKAESQWLRTPIQVGDKGVTMPADAYLGGISGLGGGTASLTRTHNLTSLVFVPAGSTDFSSVNTNAAYIAGPEGVVIQTADGASKLVVNESGMSFMNAGKTWTWNGDGFTMSTGIVAETHLHEVIAVGEPTGVPIA